jgi:hypothetical protein
MPVEWRPLVCVPRDVCVDFVCPARQRNRRTRLLERTQEDTIRLAQGPLFSTLCEIYVLGPIGSNDLVRCTMAYELTDLEYKRQNAKLSSKTLQTQMP